MKIESIHIGRTKEVVHNNESIRTGIFKELVFGAQFVTKTGIRGDEQANLKVHGGIYKAVYAYPSEHYEFWKSKRPDLEFSPGRFGENLCVSGMDENEVCVGDEFQVGEVILKVTTPRMPCSKLGIKMGDMGFVKEFLQAERSGFYFSVLKEGEIEAGENISKIGDDGHGLSIKECVQLFTERKKDKELLNKAISCPSLIDSWKEDFSTQLQNIQSDS
ncbi:MOSC domain-containing protein [Balneola sp. MJW-20]|uniref:MOSC domain-containing protein n=1 Tax=Gracilimonas aurantiaca TaxID=3234185 RepID=UPI0034652C8D